MRGRCPGRPAAVGRAAAGVGRRGRSGGRAGRRRCRGPAGPAAVVAPADGTGPRRLPAGPVAGVLGHGPGRRLAGRRAGARSSCFSPHAPSMLPELYFKYIVQDYVPGTRVSMWNHAHDDYLQSLIEWGWPGTALWAALFAGGLWSVLRRRGGRLPAWPRGSRSPSAACSCTPRSTSALQVEVIRLDVAVLLGLAWSAPLWQPTGGGAGPARVVCRGAPPRPVQAGPEVPRRAGFPGSRPGPSGYLRIRLAGCVSRRPERTMSAAARPLLGHLRLVLRVAAVLFGGVRRQLRRDVLRRQRQVGGWGAPAGRPAPAAARGWPRGAATHPP